MQLITYICCSLLSIESIKRQPVIKWQRLKKCIQEVPLSGRLCLWAQLQFTHFVNKLLLLSSITTTAILPSQLLLLSLILSKFSSADYALQNTFTDLVKWRSPTNFPLRLADCDFVSRSPCNSIITISGTLPSFSNLQKKASLDKIILQLLQHIQLPWHTEISTVLWPDCSRCEPLCYC